MFSIAKKIISVSFSLFLFTITSLVHLQAQEQQASQLPPEMIDFQHFSTKEGLGNAVVYDIVQDKQGFLWLSTGNGISRYDGYTFKNYRPDKENPRAIGSGAAIHMYLDSRNRLWIANLNKGLYRYDQKKDHFISYHHDPGDPFSISSNNVYDIAEDQQGVIWVSTLNTGLNRYDEAKGQFIRYNHESDNDNSVSSDKTYAILVDSQNDLWIIVMAGIEGTDKNALLPRYFT